MSKLLRLFFVIVDAVVRFVGWKIDGVVTSVRQWVAVIHKDQCLFFISCKGFYHVLNQRYLKSPSKALIPP